MLINTLIVEAIVLNVVIDLWVTGMANWFSS